MKSFETILFFHVFIPQHLKNVVLKFEVKIRSILGSRTKLVVGIRYKWSEPTMGVVGVVVDTIGD